MMEWEDEVMRATKIRILKEQIVEAALAQADAYLAWVSLRTSHLSEDPETHRAKLAYRAACVNTFRAVEAYEEEKG
jgi:hypothetical protein